MSVLSVPKNHRKTARKIARSPKCLLNYFPDPEVAAKIAVIVELATIEGEVPAAESGDVVAAAFLVFVGALDRRSLPSGLVLVAAVLGLIEGLADGAGQLLVATIAAALQQHVVEIEGAIFGEGDEPIQNTWRQIQ